MMSDQNHCPINDRCKVKFLSYVSITVWSILKLSNSYSFYFWRFSPFIDQIKMKSKADGSRPKWISRFMRVNWTVRQPLKTRGSKILPATTIQCFSSFPPNFATTTKNTTVKVFGWICNSFLEPFTFSHFRSESIPKKKIIL